MAGSLRRRVVAILAVAVGFGVVVGTTSANAAPAKGVHVKPVHIQPAGGTSGGVKPADWWFN